MSPPILFVIKILDLSLLNTIYHYPRKDSNGKWQSGAIDLIIKDNNTGEKFLETIVDPSYEYYMLLDGQEIPNYTLEYAMKDDCKCIIVPYQQLQKDIAERLGLLNKFYDNIRNGNIFECSFAFTIPDDLHSERWYVDSDNVYRREVNVIDGLYDMSLVIHGAYGDTNCYTRCADNEVLNPVDKITEYRKKIDKYYDDIMSELTDYKI